MADLMKRMSVEEKVAQISAQLLFSDEFYEKRDYAVGHVRNVGHFLAHAAPETVWKKAGSNSGLAVMRTKK